VFKKVELIAASVVSFIVVIGHLFSSV